MPVSAPVADSALRDLPAQAVQKSQITLPGSTPFHLRATVLNPRDPSDRVHVAEIEEYWVSPAKWRRTIKSPEFSQLVVVNGSQTHEENSGDYDPNWLRTLVNGIFDPGAPLQGLDLTQSDDNPVRGGRKICRRFATAVGIAPVSNDVFSTYCFQDGLIASVNLPGGVIQYADYAPFAGRQVARTLEEYFDSSFRPEARITELSELTAPDESLFALTDTRAPLQTIFVTEQEARSRILDAPPMVWPKVHEGRLSGVASIYVCIDRGGRVRETRALNNDHPDIADSAREQVMRWRFQTFTREGLPVQADTILTFAYSTTLDPVPAR